MELSEIYTNVCKKFHVYHQHIPYLSSLASLRWPSFLTSQPSRRSLPLPLSPLSSNVSLSNTPFLYLPPHPLRHLTTRCGNPITHVRIPAGQREGGREGECGQSITVSRPRVPARQLDAPLCISSFFFVCFLILVSGSRKKILIDTEHSLCSKKCSHQNLL